MKKVLHIVALNIPWPANYGGVIDIYYKLLALHRCGVSIILHCFEYDRPQAPELERICTEVHYYPRKTGVRANLSLTPYNVYGRRDNRLLQRLLADDYPILFEGLHSCYYLNHPHLAGRLCLFRPCNIEHRYYRKIGNAERNPLKKLFHYVEALRFYRYQRKVKRADLIIAVSQTEADYLQHVFPEKQVLFIPCFHENEEVQSRLGASDYILYHGKLSVKENEEAALYMIEHIFRHLPYKCIIAGMNPPASLYKAAKPFANIIIESTPSAERMQALTREAQIHMLMTFQGTGLKLKLLNSLFAGRHVVANPTMLVGTGLEALCHIVTTPEEAVAQCHSLMKQPFTEEEKTLREKLLYPTFSNLAQAERIVQYLS